MANARKIKIINILLSSLDGKIAAYGQESSEERRKHQFTNEDDFLHLQKLTAQCDAVFIGAKSIQSERGAFSVSHLRKTKTEPHWFIMTKSGNIDFTHPFWSQKHIPKSVFHFDTMSLCGLRLTPERSLILTTGSSLNYYRGSVSDFLDFLTKRKFKKIALLGGGELNAYFWTHHLVSELNLTLSPQIIGDKDAPQLVCGDHILRSKLKLKSVSKKKDFLFLHYKVV